MTYKTPAHMYIAHMPVQKRERESVASGGCAARPYRPRRPPSEVGACAVPRSLEHKQPPGLPLLLCFKSLERRYFITEAEERENILASIRT